MANHTSSTSEKSAAKTSKGSKNTSAGKSPGAANEENIRDMIATAAYYRAEQRGFQGGDEVGDWLEAEAEIKAAPYH